MASNTIEIKEVRTGIAHAVVLAGGQGKLAEELGVTQQAVSTWLQRGYVPLKRIVEIETLYGIPRAKLINPRLASLIELPTESEGGEL